MILDDEEIDRRLERYQVLVKRAGIKLTPQRLEIFRIIAASEEHPSAEVVHQAVRARMPMVSLDTVYRTLWLLTDLGLLATLGPRQGSVRFDANLEQHHHYFCRRPVAGRGDFSNRRMRPCAGNRQQADLRRRGPGAVHGIAAVHARVLGGLPATAGRCCAGGAGPHAHDRLASASD